LTLTGNDQPFQVLTTEGRLFSILSYVIAIAVVPGQLARYWTTISSFLLAWPRGTVFSELPSAVTSTADHPLGSPSYWQRRLFSLIIINHQLKMSIIIINHRVTRDMPHITPYATCQTLVGL
jgi:hypothetical protein